jgi:hypothetical protein
VPVGGQRRFGTANPHGWIKPGSGACGWVCLVSVGAAGDQGVTQARSLRFGSCWWSDLVPSEIDGRRFHWRCLAGWAVLGWFWVVWCIDGWSAVTLRRRGFSYNDFHVMIVVRPGCVHGGRPTLPPAVLGWVGGSLVLSTEGRVVGLCWEN